MTFRAVLQRTGISIVRRIALLLGCVLVVSGLSGCGGGAHSSAVQAVAARVPSLAPFFDEKQGLGQDAAVRSMPVRGSLQQGDTPGLYGGTKKPTVCDVAKLKRFLTDPANRPKAVAWSGVLGITTDRIPAYLDRLTPVLLRHDTLVQNHDYKKERPRPTTPFSRRESRFSSTSRGNPPRSAPAEIHCAPSRATRAAFPSSSRTATRSGTDITRPRSWPCVRRRGRWRGSRSSTSTIPTPASRVRSVRRAGTTPPSTPGSSAPCPTSRGQRSGTRGGNW